MFQVSILPVLLILSTQISYKMENKFMTSKLPRSQILFPNNTLWVFSILKYPKKCLEDLTTFFMSTWWGDSKNMEDIEFLWWLFEGRLRQGKKMLTDCWIDRAILQVAGELNFVFFVIPSIPSSSRNYNYALFL